MMFDFFKLRESVESLGRQLQDVRSQIETAKQQIETVIYAPSHPDDILAAATKWVKGKEKKYESYFSDRIFQHFISKPGRFENEIKLDSDLSHLSLSADAPDFAFVGLIGSDRIIEIFEEHAAKIPPDKHGLKSSERGPALAALEKTLLKLRAEEAKLVEGAAAAGLAV